MDNHTRASADRNQNIIERHHAALEHIAAQIMELRALANDIDFVLFGKDRNPVGEAKLVQRPEPEHNYVATVRGLSGATEEINIKIEEVMIKMQDILKDLQ